MVGGEAVEWPPVVGVQNPPVLDVGDDTLDDGANSIDSTIEGPLPVEQFTLPGLLDWRDHVSADVAFVARPVAGIECGEHAGFIQAEHVVVSPFDRIGDPHEFALEGAHDLNVHARGLVLTRVQPRVGGP